MLNLLEAQSFHGIEAFNPSSLAQAASRLRQIT
jgi:hypothetical protein